MSKKELLSFFSDSLLYTIINIVNKAIPFLLLPFIIRAVSTSEYGKYSLYLTTEMMLIPLVGLSLHSAVNRHYFEKDNIDFSTYLSSIIRLQLLVIIGFTTVLFIITTGHEDIFGVSRHLVLLSVLTAGSASLINNIVTYYRAARQPRKYGIFVLLQSVFLFISILLFLNIKPIVDGIVYGRLTAFLLFAIIGLFLLKKYNLFSFYSVFDKKLLRYALKFSLPTIPHAFAAFLFVYSDRYLIKYFLGDVEVGLYSGIFQVATIISVLAMSFNAAWIPWIFEKLKENREETNMFVIKLTYSIKLFFIVAGVLFFFLFPFISGLVLTEEFQQWNYISGFLILGFVFQALYFTIVPYIFYVEKTKYLSYLSVSAAFINIGFNIILIPRYGIYGAAISTCISWLLLYISTFLLSTKIYSMPWFRILGKSFSKN